MHGQDLETYWRTTFGYGLDCCTEVEASYIARQPTVDAIATVMGEAATKARGEGVSTIGLERLDSAQSTQGAVPQSDPPKP